MHISRVVVGLVIAFAFVAVLTPAAEAQGSVSVTSGTEVATVTPNSSANQVAFTVKNTATDNDHADYFELECIATGAASSCTVSTASVLLDAQEHATVRVTFGAGSTGRGAVTLIAWGKNWRGYDPGHCLVAVAESGGQPSK